MTRTRSSLLDKLRDWRNEASWQEFFDAYWRLIYSVAIKSGLTEEESRDVVQETVLSVAKQMRQGGYDLRKSSFKTWLCVITKRRIADHFRSRTDPKFRARPIVAKGEGTDTVHRIPDPGVPAWDAVWEEEWRNNLLGAAMERVKRQVDIRHYQIYDLAVFKGLPASEVGALLNVTTTHVYVVRHRVGKMVKRALKQLEERGVG